MRAATTRSHRRSSTEAGRWPRTRRGVGHITLAWLTNIGVFWARVYWETELGFVDVKGVTVPAALSVFPRKIYPAPRSWAERACPNPTYFKEVGRGSQFAAWQELDLFTAEVRVALRALR
jgi:hypothetical protein